FAVGDPTSPEARFAARLAAVLKNNTSRLQLKIVSNPDSAKALAQFDRREANLAVLRTDAKIPAHARSLAILDHDVVLLLSPGGKKIKTVAELRKKKIAVMADSDSGATFVRNVLEIPDNANGISPVQLAPPGSTFEKLFASENAPTNTDKATFIVAHQGAAQYINDDTKSFIERYSNLIDIGAAALSITRSISATPYTKVTRVAPEKASELGTARLELGED